MISRYVSSSPALGSVLTAQSLEPVSDSVSPSLSAPPPLARSLSKINKHSKKIFNKNKKIKSSVGEGAGVAQSVKHLTLDFDSGHDLVCGS